MDKEKLSTMKKIGAFLVNYAIPFLVICVIVYVLTYVIWRDEEGIVITQNHLFWIFSTIVQAFVALVALLGMVGIFRLQLINNKEDGLEDSIRGDADFISFQGAPADSYNREEILQAAKKLISERGEGVPIIKKLATDFESLSAKENKTKKGVRNFIIYSLIVVFVALLFLGFTPLITKYCLGILFLCIILVLSFYNLFLAGKLTYDILTSK